MPYCTECSSEKRRLNKDKLCNDCAGKETLSSEGTSDTPPLDLVNSDSYWENMNKLFDRKFSDFEETFKNAILTEVKQITDPIAKDVKELKDEN